MQQLERTLAYHGAPALAGIKSADLIAWGCPQVCASPAFLAYCRELARRGIQLRVLRSGCPRCLLLVYRREKLEQQLAAPGVSALLEREGYPVRDGLEAMLAVLSRRLSGGSFPHEVGLFLGYPPEDVEGFRLHQGRNCKLSGCWKVYCNACEARRLFARFDKCRAVYARLWNQGRSVRQLTVAA